MSRSRKLGIWTSILLALLVLAVSVVRRLHRRAGESLTLVGSVIKQNSDTRKESPIADVNINLSSGTALSSAKSDFSGYFAIKLPTGADPDAPMMLHFRHPDYEPADIRASLSNRVYVIRMIPIHGEESELSASDAKISNVLVRYTIEITTTENIGTGVKTFQIPNTGNVPCYPHVPCSPDGKWKAAIGAASLDAGDGNVFQNARVSCIAGPCAFTKIDSDDFSKSARTINVAVRNWSDTTTFLLQAEVFHSQVRDIVRKSYPIIFGRSLNFTLPANTQGVTIEAEINGSQIIFPLAPDPQLSWANCKVKMEANLAKDYRCELKPGYRFPL